MIFVRITMRVLPEKKKELLQTLSSIIGSMGMEPGCLAYAALCDIEDKNLLIILEEWKTRKDLDHHLKSEMFGVLMGTRSLLNEPLRVQIHTIHKSEGLEAVDAARRKEINRV